MSSGAERTSAVRNQFSAISKLYCIHSEDILSRIASGLHFHVTSDPSRWGKDEKETNPFYLEIRLHYIRHAHSGQIKLASEKESTFTAVYVDLQAETTIPGSPERKSHSDK